jgi:hypothetical protein
MSDSAAVEFEHVFKAFGNRLAQQKLWVDSGSGRRPNV